MSGPAEHSTNLPEPTGPTDDRFVYHLEPAGLQALADYEAATGEQLHHPAAPFSEVREAVDREQTRRRRVALRREAKRNGHRFATISYRWDGKKKLPLLRLSGQWLHDAGFPLGQELEVTVRERQLVIDAV
jgi:hypothetical protein